MVVYMVAKGDRLMGEVKNNARVEVAGVIAAGMIHFTPGDPIYICTRDNRVIGISNRCPDLIDPYLNGARVTKIGYAENGMSMCVNIDCGY